MLRIHTSTSADAAKHYFREGLSTPDYYAEKGQEIGRWGGKGAEMLDLIGGVEQEHFYRLTENRHPQTGDKLTPRTKEGRRVGYDMTFNAPKSVSIAYAMGNAETKILIREAFENAVTHAMDLMEKDMQTRLRTNGQNGNRTTGNMVWAAFTHDTSRPMDDGIPDPHLHVHCYTFNTTFDSIENRWKAGEFAAIKRDGNYFEALFHNQLATNLQKQGFAITPTKDRWELSGISRGVIESFSRRTTQIEDIAKTQGITNTKIKSGLAATTRNSKQDTKPWNEIQHHWKERFSRKGQASIESLRHAHEPHQMGSDLAVDYALDHLLERQSVIRERDVIRMALRHGVGAVKLKDIKASLNQKTIQKTINNERLISTRSVLHEEQSLFRSIKQGRGAFKPLGPTDITIQSDFLNDQQKDVIQSALFSKDRVTAIIGRAGVGKTTVMKEIADNIAQTDRRVYAFAPSADASRNLLRGEGFSGADTVARLLVDPKMQSMINGQVIWIDEAGQLGTRSLNKVLQLAEQHKARVILTGDPKQHNSVERGDALRLLEKRTGMQTMYLDTIVRQKRSLFRRAVEAISKGQLSSSLEKLESLEAFQEIKNDKERYGQIAEEYTKSVIREQSVLVVSPTHKEGRQVTQAIRERLRIAGIVGKNDSSKVVLKNLSLTEAEKSYSGNFEANQVIQFTQNLKGFTRGEAVTVMKPKDRNHLIVQHQNGEHSSLSLEYAKRFTVYKRDSLPLSKGDTIRITQNSFTKYNHHRLNNGAYYQVKQINRNGDITLSNGWILDKDFGHLAHAYVSTSHASQGKTVDKILIAQSSHSFGKASTQEQFYVSVSRGKSDVRVYTDDAEALKSQLTKTQTRMTATEMMSSNKRKESWFGILKTAVNRYRQMAINRLKQPQTRSMSTVSRN